MADQSNFYGMPPKQGLYDPRFEKDGCGIGFVANIKGQKSHEIIQQGLQVLQNLHHRGAQGCDTCTGDGAGILMQVSHEFFRPITGMGWSLLWLRFLRTKKLATKSEKRLTAMLNLLDEFGECQGISPFLDAKDRIRAKLSAWGSREVFRTKSGLVGTS